MSTAQDLDALLAAALRGDDAAWPDGADEAVSDALVERILYHGVAGLLFARVDRLADWPGSVIAAIRHQAIAQAMWEMRHQVVLKKLLAALGARGVRPILLKGTSFAYDFYDAPSARGRGDTDLLVASSEVSVARDVLRLEGFSPDLEAIGQLDPARLQEPWTHVAQDGSEHSIDLHWQVLNSWALVGVLTHEEAARDAQQLERLSPEARRLSRAQGLLHACIHRAQHEAAPMVFKGALHYGGDRLIWLHDIALFAQRLSDAEWSEFCDIASRKGVAGACVAGLEAARAHLGAGYPEFVNERLANVPPSRADRYLVHSRQIGRALSDFAAVPGLRLKGSHLRWRLFPSTNFLRAKYPGMREAPLPLLHARRLYDFIRRRES